MYTTQLIVLGLAALAPLISARPNSGFSVLPRQNGVSCQTSGGSPTTEDVTAVINQLKGQGGVCSQTNGHASDCTTLVSHNSAAISICGGTDAAGTGNSCADVANYADEVQQACLSGDLTGGEYTLGPSQRVEVIHS